MPRLGRGRRRGAKVIRGASPPTPPVRRPASPVNRQSKWRPFKFRPRITRAGRSHPVYPPKTSHPTQIVLRQMRKTGRRGARVITSPDLVTPTPLVRNRVLSHPDTRAALAARRGRRHNQVARPRMTILRSKPASVHIPQRSSLIHRRFRGIARIVRPPHPLAIPGYRPNVAAVHPDSRAARLGARLGRGRRPGAHITRAPSTPTIASRTGRAPLREARRTPPAFTRRHAVHLSQGHFTQPAKQPPRRGHVSGRVRAQVLRALRHRPAVIRGRSTPTPTPLARQAIFAIQRPSTARVHRHFRPQIHIGRGVSTPTAGPVSPLLPWPEPPTISGPPPTPGVALPLLVRTGSSRHRKGSHIIRPVSTTTPPTVIVPGIALPLLVRTGSSRHRKGSHIVRPVSASAAPFTPPPPVVPPPAPPKVRLKAPARLMARTHHKPQLKRARATTTATPYVHRSNVSVQTRRSRTLARRRRAHLIVRPAYQPAQATLTDRLRMLIGLGL